MKLIDVYFVGIEFRCELDKSINCIHTKFVWASPGVRLSGNGSSKSKSNISEKEKDKDNNLTGFQHHNVLRQKN